LIYTVAGKGDKLNKQIRITFLSALLFTFILISILIAEPVFAWHFNGHFWIIAPVDLYFLVEPNVSTESWCGWYNAQLVWNDAPDSPTEFIYTEDDSIDVITCEYANNPLTWSGYSWFNPDSGYISKAGAWINEYFTDAYSYYKRVSTAAHEFGHVIGLAHNSGAYLMEHYDSIRYDDNGIYSPTPTDIDEVNALY
jgi:hypothetical protein